MRPVAPLLAVVMTLTAGRPGMAEETFLPPGLAAVAETPAETTRWNAAIEDLRSSLRDGPTPSVRRARARLKSGGAVALKHAAAALLAAPPGDAVAEHLALVVGADPNPAVDAVLARLARSPSSSLRALAADGLAFARTPEGVATLAALAADAFPGVRAAALRALFAREDEPAVRARAALPVDPDPGLEERRLLLHRLRKDGGPDVAARARSAWTAGATPAVRMAGARLLAEPALATPTPALLDLVRTLGRGPLAATFTRWLADAPLQGFDPVEERRAAVDAAVALLAKGDVAAPDRAELIDLAVEWLAHPVPMDPQSAEPLAEARMRRRLPDLGAEALPALERRFLPGGFAAPRDGALLLGEMAPDVVLPTLARLLARGRPQPVRAAASGALRTLGTLGTEALARLLTAPEEDASIRRDALGALAEEKAPWVVPLLGPLLSAPLVETVEAAGDALEERPEPEARELLEAFVLDGRCQEHRLQARLARLFTPWDVRARGTWTKTMASPRAALRAATLALTARMPSAALQDLLPELRAYAPRLKGAAEVEAWLPALLRVAPEEGLAYLTAHWDDFPVGSSLASTRCRALAALDFVRGTGAARAVAVLLEKAGPSDDAHLLVHALDALAGRSGSEDAALDALFRRLLAGEGVAGGPEWKDEVAAATVTALEKPGRGDLTPLLLPLLAAYVLDGNLTHRAVALLRALEHQPWQPLEAPVMALALDGTVPASVRAAAGWLLAGRASPAARAEMLRWFLTAGANAPDPQVLLALAAAVGTGGGPETARALATALRTELLAFYDRPGALDPFGERVDALPVRIQALTAGVAHTGHAPSLDELTGLLFEPRFATWADAVLHRAALQGTEGEALATLSRSPKGNVLRLEEGLQGASVLPPEVATLAMGLKGLGDEALAASLRRTLADPALAEVLPTFPDAWAFKLAALLHDPRSRDEEEAARVLEDLLAALDPADGALELVALEGRAERDLGAGRFAEAGRAARRLRGLLARRGLELAPDGREPWLSWLALGTGCEAAVAGERGDEDVARREFARAADLAADAPEVLARLARVQARAGVDPETAEELADRALALERRVDNEETLASVGALAEVLLRRNRPGAAVRRLGAALGRGIRTGHARHHLLLAETLAAHGDRAGAAQSLRQALLLEPSLDREVRSDPWLASLKEDGTLERVLAEAEAARRAGEEE